MAGYTDQLTYEGIPASEAGSWTSHQQALVRALAHEIRSTLASAKICAEALGGPDPPAEDKRRRYAAVVAEQASHIARLLDDFAAVISYDSADEAPVTGLVDINTAVWEAAHQLYPIARQRAISLQLSPSSSPSVVKGSNARLTQALRGCLEYALRTAAEASRIQVAVEHTSDHRRRPVVVIRMECTNGPENSRPLRLLTSSVLDTVTLRAVQLIVQAHQGYVEALDGDSSGLRVVLPRHLGVGAGQLPNGHQWYAQTGPEDIWSQDRVVGL